MERNLFHILQNEQTWYEVCGCKIWGAGAVMGVNSVGGAPWKAGNVSWTVVGETEPHVELPVLLRRAWFWVFCTIFDVYAIGGVPGVTEGGVPSELWKYQTPFGATV